MTATGPTSTGINLQVVELRLQVSDSTRQQPTTQEVLVRPGHYYHTGVIGDKRSSHKLVTVKLRQLIPQGTIKSFIYEKFVLWVMLSLCFSCLASPFSPNVFHFLTNHFKICEIFFSCEKKTMKLGLLHKSVNTPSHRKGNLMALIEVYQFEL